MRVRARVLIVLFGVYAMIASAGAHAEQPARPNFIIVLVADLGYGDIGCYGSTVNETP